MIRKVRQHITDNQLFGDDSKILLAVSGGPDSVAMVDILHRLHIKFAISHVNFQLRGADSDGDEDFVRNLAQKYKAEIYVLKADTKKYAKDKSLSIEMAAREIRYAEFGRIMDSHGYSCTAVAHHQDDSIETFFLNLCRGAGIRGLAGIKVKNQRIVRPLLCLTRRDIEKYLSDRGLDYRIDKTNLESEFSRNKIRNKIIPLLEEINPSVRSSIAESLGYLQIAKEIYESSVEQSLEEARKFGSRIPIEWIQKHQEPECITYELCSQYGFNKSQTRQIYHSLDGEPGKTFSSPTHTILKDRSHLIISEASSKGNTDSIATIKIGEIPAPSIKTKSHTLEQELIKPADFCPERNARVMYLDIDKLRAMEGELTITGWQPGDSITMFGGKKKKVQDLLVDQKLSLLDKNRVEILRKGHTILWVIGIRASNYCRVDQSTKDILKITAK
ncbi:MAG: tRNA lysidine(34) synthetase TilS [Bacteroidales bacterium]|nr:tRNA lysidine(34) synthetase TilS [Bacteroidales bacterium]